MRPVLAREAAAESLAAWPVPPGRSHAVDRDADEPLAEPDDRLLIVHDPLDPRCERVRQLRTELQLRRAPGLQGDIVVLLSPCAGEGRSQLAAELAIAYAQLGRSTLLVDADLRRPRQHALFGLHAGPGLVEAIDGGVWPPFRSVRGLPRLSLLTAGDAPQDPLRLLCDPRFSLLVDDWRETFEQVVIDTPPAGAYSDALAVAGVAGRVLALSRARRTPTHEMHDMLSRLAAQRAQVLGAVISHF